MQSGINELLTIQAEQSALPPALLRENTAKFLARCNWDRNQIEAFQQEKLKALLAHAVQNSSYYAQTIGTLVAQGAPFTELPTINKQQLMENFDRIVTDPNLNRGMVETHLDGPRSGTLLLGKYRTVATSGTTGIRGVFIYDEPTWCDVISVIGRAQRQTGITAETRSIGIGAPTPLHISNRMFAERRASRPEVPRLDVTMPMDQVVSALNTFQPAAIVTYPSFIHALAQEQQQGRLKIAPKIFRTAAEALLPEVETLAFNLWGCTVFEGYACS